MRVMLLMATSSVTGSSVGARDKASVTGMTFSGFVRQLVSVVF